VTRQPNLPHKVSAPTPPKSPLSLAAGGRRGQRTTTRYFARPIVIKMQARWLENTGQSLSSCSRDRTRQVPNTRVPRTTDGIVGPSRVARPLLRVTRKQSFRTRAWSLRGSVSVQMRGFRRAASRHPPARRGGGTQQLLRFCRDGHVGSGDVGVSVIISSTPRGVTSAL
jgi:hypothetical protein